MFGVHGRLLRLRAAIPAKPRPNGPHGESVDSPVRLRQPHSPRGPPGKPARSAAGTLCRPVIALSTSCAIYSAGTRRHARAIRRGHMPRMGNRLRLRNGRSGARTRAFQRCRVGGSTPRSDASRSSGRPRIGHRSGDFKYRAVGAARAGSRRSYICRFRHASNSRVGCHARRCGHRRCGRGRPTAERRVRLRRGRGGAAAVGGEDPGGARRSGRAAGGRGTARAGGRLGRVRGPADRGRPRCFRAATAKRVPGLGRGRARGLANGRCGEIAGDRRSVLRHRRPRARGRERTGGLGRAARRRP